MSDPPPEEQSPPDLPPEGAPEDSGPDSGAQDVQHVQVRNVTARVPTTVGKGVFSTAAIVMTGSNEFIIDLFN